MSDKKLKLEVGKKYIIPLLNPIDEELLNPHQFLCNDDGRYVFRTNDGQLVDYFIEHREPIKRTIEGWINYHPKGSANESVMLDKITGLFVFNEIFQSKEIAHKRCNHLGYEQMYGRFTFEEIPDVTE